jgi:parallel beta-helix repeat protein
MVSMIKTDYIIVNTPRPPITIYVPDDYPSIQEAIDAGTTMDRDTIIVRDGVYKQNTLVNKELIIRSENGSEYCQLFPEIPLNHHMITIISDNVTIDGFFMNGTRSWYDEPGSIYVNEVDNVTICNNWINDSSHGIVLENNNLSHNKGSGLWLCGDYHLISNNTVNNNTGYGLRLCGDYHLISNNTVNNNGGGIECSNYNEIIGNTINNNWDGLRIISGNGNIISNNTMNSNHHHGLFLDGAYNIVHDNIMQENTVYDLYTQYNNNVYLNTGSGNRPIIYANETIIIENMVISSLILVDADYSLIKNVTVAGSETLRNNGIYARSCDYVEFINVTSNHNYQGIDMTPAVYFVLVGQEDNIFTDCSFKDNRRDGVRIGGDRNKIENCDISFNQNYGVYFYEFSKDSSIVNSTLNNNSWLK